MIDVFILGKLWWVCCGVFLESVRHDGFGIYRWHTFEKEITGTALVSMTWNASFFGRNN